jgi:membrane-associated phospholipid phosphatase
LVHFLAKIIIPSTDIKAGTENGVVIMSSLLRISFCLLAMGMHSVQAAESRIYKNQDDSLRTYGDRMQFLLPGGALVATLFKEDYEGSWQLTQAFLVNTAVVYGTKNAVGRLRPDGSTSNSFPSGHTSAAFVGAGFVRFRYGAQWAAPMYTLAGFVGLSRVWANRHFLDDTLTGASLGVFSNLLFVTPFYKESPLSFMPTMNDDLVGMQFTYDWNKSWNTQSKWDVSRYQYNMVVGAVYDGMSYYHAVDAKQDIELSQSDMNYSAYSFNVMVTPNSEVRFKFAPFIIRQESTMTEAFTLQEEVYAKDEKVVTSVQNYLLSGHWYYRLFNDSPVILDLGLGFSWQQLQLELDKADGSKYAFEEHYNVYNELYARVGFDYGQVVMFGEGTINLFDNLSRLSAQGFLGYRFNQNWLVGYIIGYEKDKDTFVFEDKEYQHDSELRYMGVKVSHYF